MSLILMIDTAQETAFVSISKNGEPIGYVQNDIQKEVEKLYARWAELEQKKP